MLLPQTGDIIRVRARQYLVEGVTPPPVDGESALIHLACVEDDAQGERLEVLWDKEIDRQLPRDVGWEQVASRGFDDPRFFSSYLHTLRWSCVTSTDAGLFQSPYRAGIEVKAYQLQPLRLALQMPRVNLFIADDVGLGKTIEAGLILRELLLRQRVRRCVVVAPPSVTRQWQEEMEQRFGLTFILYDRDYLTQTRQERGYSANPWTTHTRFIISQALIRDEAYAAPLRDWLRSFDSGAMLILDEAHNVAPASGGRYAVDSKLTKAMRDLAPRFAHKLFLSATPHNGHANSFSALLELLDPQRFCRGVDVDPALRDEVMVRRLKADLREIGEQFPKREVLRVVIDGLPEDAPELTLSRLLQRYRLAREARLAESTKAQKAAAMLVVTSLQKRLLSSIEAFARTLAVHRRSMKTKASAVDPARLGLLTEGVGADDERAELDEAEVQAEEEAQMALASAAAGEAMGEELSLLDRMTEIAQVARYEPDARLQHLLAWVRAELCPELGAEGAAWMPKRVLIFTEYTDTKRWLVQQLEHAIRHSDDARRRVATFHGGMGEESREEVKRAFNADPADHPLRILVATDAAREGVNLQNNCAELFHFDVPWNPSRLEQRNGRVDRKLQKAPVVRCRYFVLPQRAEDRVLEVLVEKTRRIHEQLGSLSPVVERRLARTLTEGIRHDRAQDLAQAIERADAPDARSKKVEEELESNRKRRDALRAELATLRDMLQRSQEWLGLDDRHFRDALSASLEFMGAEPLRPVHESEAVEDLERAQWALPALHERFGADPSWASTLDTLRGPRDRHKKEWEWRKDAPIRPVVFKDPGNLDGEVVHLHLEHRVVRRLLGRFLTQGFTQDGLSRACVLRTDEAIPRVVLLGRLSLFGDDAARLHDEVLAAAAEWTDPAERGRARLKPLGERDKADVLRLVEDALARPRLRDVPAHVRTRLQACAARDVSELAGALERRAEVLAQRAERDLDKRGEQEAEQMREIILSQQVRIRRQQKKLDEKPQQMGLFDDAERHQLAANRSYWAQRLVELAEELETEPARVRRSYGVRAQRVQPIGVVYLWPVSS